MGRLEEMDGKRRGKKVRKMRERKKRERSSSLHGLLEDGGAGFLISVRRW